MVTTAKTTPTPRKPGEKLGGGLDLNQFAREGESIHVQNTLSTITVFQIVVDGNPEECEFAASGDPSGEDVMELPAVYLKNKNFKDALRKGIFRIIDGDDPAVVEAYDNQQSTYEANRAAKEESDRFVAMQPVRAFSGTQCLAPEGRGQCVEYAISASNNRERPPLCSKHSHLASQFTPEETGRFTDGKPDIQWNRVTILGA